MDWSGKGSGQHRKGRSYYPQTRCFRTALGLYYRGLNYNEDNYKVQSHAFGVAAGSADIFPCIPAISEASLLQLCSIV